MALIHWPRQQSNFLFDQNFFFFLLLSLSFQTLYFFRLFSLNPLSIVSLQGSIPPSWSKDFISSQSKRLKLQSKFRLNIEDIFAQLCLSFTKPKPQIGSGSVAVADIVTLGDSWLPFAIRKAVIEPFIVDEQQDWFKGLSNKWKVYLRRNFNGDIDPQGQIWAAPYRSRNLPVEKL